MFEPSVLRENWQNNLKGRQTSDQVRDILINNGSKQIVYNLFQALIDPGDEVIVPSPY